MKLIPVDGDPFARGKPVRLVPVEGNPFAPDTGNTPAPGFVDAFTDEAHAIGREYKHLIKHPIDTARGIGQAVGVLVDNPGAALAGVGRMVAQAKENPAAAAGQLAAQVLNPINFVGLGAGGLAARLAAAGAKKALATAAGATTGAVASGGLNVADEGMRAAAEGRQVTPEEAGGAALLGAGLGGLFSVPVAHRMAGKAAPEAVEPKPAAAPQGEVPLELGPSPYEMEARAANGAGDVQPKTEIGSPKTEIGSAKTEIGSAEDAPEAASAGAQVTDPPRVETVAASSDGATPSSGVLFSREGGEDVIEPPAHVARWMGFDKLKVRANFDALARRHSEYYASADEVRRDVEFVLQKPENWYPHADGRITLVRESERGDIPGVRIDFRFEKDGAVRIASVYRLTKRGLVKKMKQKKVAVEALSQTGDARRHIADRVDPGQLAIADYLHMQRQAKGDGSWLPGSPSREPLKASTADTQIQDRAAVDVKAHRDHLKRAFGQAAETLERTGKLKIAASDAELPDHLMAAGSQGAFDPKSGTVYLMAHNVRPEETPAIVAHEFMHDFTAQGEGRALLDDLAAMEARAKGDDPLARWFEEARARVPEGTPEAHRLHEIAAYAVQRVVAGQERKVAIREWVSRLLAKVKAWLIRRKFPWAHLDDKGLAEIAIRHLKETARRAGGHGDGASSNGVMFARISKEEVSRLLRSLAESAGEVAAPVGDGRFQTPIGEVRLGGNQLEKMEVKGRGGDVSLIRPTLERPIAVFRDEKGALIFLKPFMDNGLIRFVSVAYRIDGQNIVVSSHRKRAAQIAALFEKGEPLYMATALGEKFPRRNSGSMRTVTEKPDGINAGEALWERSAPSHTISARDGGPSTTPSRENETRIAEGLRSGDQSSDSLRSIAENGADDNAPPLYSRAAGSGEDALRAGLTEGWKEAARHRLKGAAGIGYFVGRYFYFKPAQVIRDMGTETARALADLIYKEHGDGRPDDFMGRRQFAEGKFLARVDDALEPLRGRFGIRREDSEAIIRWLNGTKKGVPAHLAEPAKKIRGILHDLLKYQNEAGAEIGELSYYFPRVYDTAKLMLPHIGKGAFVALLREHGYRNADAIWARIVNNEGAPHRSAGDESARIEVDASGQAFERQPLGSRRTMDSGSARRFAHEKERRLEIPYDKLAPFLINDLEAVLGRYVHHAVTRAEYARLFGKAEGKLNAMVRRIVDEWDEHPHPHMELREFVQHIYGLADAIQGRKPGFSNAGANLAAKGIANIETMIHLPLVALASVPEFFTPLAQGKARHWAGGLFVASGDALREATIAAWRKVSGQRAFPESETRRWAMEIGAILPEAVNGVFMTRYGAMSGRLTNRFMRMTLLEQMTNMQRVVATHTFRRTWLDIARAEDGRQRQAWLNHYGLDAGELKAWVDAGAPPDGPVAEVIARQVQQVITSPTEAQIPLFLQQPGVNLVFQFKRFVTAFSNTFLKSIWQRLHLEKEAGTLPAYAAKVVTMVAASTLAAYWTQYLRDALKYAPDERRKWLKHGLRDWKRRMLDAFDRAGWTGDVTTLYQFWNPYRFGYTSGERRLFNLAGPLVGDSARVLDIMSRDGVHAADKNAKAIARMTPVLNATHPTRAAWEKQLRALLR